MASVCLWLLYLFLQGSVSEVWLCLLLLLAWSLYHILKKWLLFISWKICYHVHICGVLPWFCDHGCGCTARYWQQAHDASRTVTLQNGSSASLFPAKAWQSLDDWL